MAAATAPILQAPPPHCGRPGDARFIERPWHDGWGRIRYCRVPYTCKRWRPGEPIPYLWAEIFQPMTLSAGDECVFALAPTTNQAAAVNIDRSDAAAASRLPRSPRQARTPRPPRPPRPPRAPRPARPPRPPRAPRASRAAPPPTRTPAPGRKPLGHWCQNPNIWPAAWRAQDAPCGPDDIEGCEVIDVHQGHEWHSIQPCPGADKNRCQQQAAAFVRPLQQLLGWTRPTFPSRAEIAQRPKPKPPAPVTPPAPGVPAPPAPPPITYLVPPKYTCLKNGAFNLVDCYTADQFGNPIDLFWSNHIDGPWRGEPAPPNAPGGAGIGAKVS